MIFVWYSRILGSWTIHQWLGFLGNILTGNHVFSREWWGFPVHVSSNPLIESWDLVGLQAMDVPSKYGIIPRFDEMVILGILPNGQPAGRGSMMNCGVAGVETRPFPWSCVCFSLQSFAIRFCAFVNATVRPSIDDCQLFDKSHFPAMIGINSWNIDWTTNQFHGCFHTSCWSDSVCGFVWN